MLKRETEKKNLRGGCEVTVHKDEDDAFETFSPPPPPPFSPSNPGFDFYAADSNDASLG